MTVWFTGLHAAGKSTLAHQLELELLHRRRPVCLLEGEELRRGLTADLGDRPLDRSLGLGRMAEVAALLADAGIVAVVTGVSARAADRRRARDVHDRARLPFLEVHVSTPLPVCERRDPKGLYALARAGWIEGVPGVHVPYEVAEGADLVIDATHASPRALLDEIVGAMGLRYAARG